jgi:hypothetical protein
MVVIVYFDATALHESNDIVPRASRLVGQDSVE